MLRDFIARRSVQYGLPPCHGQRWKSSFVQIPAVRKRNMHVAPTLHFELTAKVDAAIRSQSDSARKTAVSNKRHRRAAAKQALRAWRHMELPADECDQIVSSCHVAPGLPGFQRKPSSDDRVCSRRLRDEVHTFMSRWRGLHGLQKGMTWREGEEQGRGVKHEPAPPREHEKGMGGEGGGEDEAWWVRCPLAAEHGRVLGMLPTQPLTTTSADSILTICQLKHAFRTFATKWHPDLHPDATKSEAESRFKAGLAAYQALVPLTVDPSAS